MLTLSLAVPALIFERLWKSLGLPLIFQEFLADRKFAFDLELAVFLTVLHRLFISGSDRSCNQWRRDYAIGGADGIDLHHLYGAMAFLGEVLSEQVEATPFAPRCNKAKGRERLKGAAGGAWLAVYTSSPKMRRNGDLSTRHLAISTSVDLY
jgi:hypothetical protein